MKEALRLPTGTLELAPDQRNGARLTLTDVSTFRGIPQVAGMFDDELAGVRLEWRRQWNFVKLLASLRGC